MERNGVSFVAACMSRWIIAPMYSCPDPRTMSSVILMKVSSVIPRHAERPSNIFTDVLAVDQVVLVLGNVL